MRNLSQPVWFDSRYISNILSPGTLRYSDDPNILTMVNINSSGQSSEVSFVDNIQKDVQDISGLELNMGKLVVFSSYPNKSLTKISQLYKTQNVSSLQITHLGHVFTLNDHQNSAGSIQEIKRLVENFLLIHYWYL